MAFPLSKILFLLTSASQVHISVILNVAFFWKLLKYTSRKTISTFPSFTILRHKFSVWDYLHKAPKFRLWELWNQWYSALHSHHPRQWRLANRLAITFVGWVNEWMSGWMNEWLSKTGIKVMSASWTRSVLTWDKYLSK